MDVSNPARCPVSNLCLAAIFVFKLASSARLDLLWSPLSIAVDVRLETPTSGRHAPATNDEYMDEATQNE